MGLVLLITLAVIGVALTGIGPVFPNNRKKLLHVHQTEMVEKKKDREAIKEIDSIKG